jgi:hypothetical protein
MHTAVSKPGGDKVSSTEQWHARESFSVSRCSYVVRQPSKITYLNQLPTSKCQNLGRGTGRCVALAENNNLDQLTLSRNFTSPADPSGRGTKSSATAILASCASVSPAFCARSWALRGAGWTQRWYLRCGTRTRLSWAAGAPGSPCVRVRRRDVVGGGITTDSELSSCSCSWLWTRVRPINCYHRLLSRALDYWLHYHQAVQICWYAIQLSPLCAFNVSVPPLFNVLEHIWSMHDHCIYHCWSIMCMHGSFLEKKIA